MGTVKRLCAALLFAARLYADPLPVAVVNRPYSHQLASSGGGVCTGYQPVFQMAGGALPEGLRLHTNGQIAGEPVRIDSGSIAVRITTPCSETLRDFEWAVRGEPILIVEPAELTLDSATPTAIALVSASWPGLAYTITSADGESAPAWLRVRPRRGRTPPPGSPLTGDRLSISIDPSLAPPGATARLLILAWQGCEQAELTIRFGTAR
jgi:hypothetical protein